MVMIQHPVHRSPHVISPGRDRRAPSQIAQRINYQTYKNDIKKMNKVRVTKEFTFEMAHALWNYDGACKNIHGHSYRLFVTIKGEPIRDEDNVKYGMVM